MILARLSRSASAAGILPPHLALAQTYNNADRSVLLILDASGA